MNSIHTESTLVSVGIPCFNRPALLKRAIQSVQAQSYRHLEIIVSDNASTDPAVEDLIRSLALSDPRIKYFRQPENLGPMRNFEYALQASTAPYFMWVADDDWIEPFFIEEALAALNKAGDQTVLVALAAQYETAENDYRFFHEGRHIRSIDAPPGFEYVAAVAGSLYGNLIYGLFRKDALRHNGRWLTSYIGKTLNELPFFVLAASKGRLDCIDKIGLHKRAPLHVCRAAEWERIGGVMPGGPAVINFGRARSLIRYHARVADEIDVAIADMSITSAEKSKLSQRFRTLLQTHQRQMLLGWKPRLN